MRYFKEKSSKILWYILKKLRDDKELIGLFFFLQKDHSKPMEWIWNSDKVKFGYLFIHIIFTAV